MFHDILSGDGATPKLTKAIPVTLSTRIRLARNLSEFPFPGRAEASQKRAVLTKCMEALTDIKELNDVTEKFYILYLILLCP